MLINDYPAGLVKTAISAILVCVMVVTIAGCGGNHGALDLAGSSQPGAIQQSISDGQGDSLPVECPEGIDPDVYTMLKEVMEAMVESLPPGKKVSGLPEGPAGYVRDLRIEVSDFDHARLKWTYTNHGDYDHNSRVNASDITVIGYNYETYEGDANWAKAKKADGNHDGAVTVADLTAIGANYGNFIPRYAVYRSKNPMDYPPFNGGVPGDSAERLFHQVGVAYNFHPSYSIDNWDAGWYYWIVPTDNVIDGQVSNLAGGPVGDWPLISSIDPAHGLPGTEVIIQGSGFNELSEECRIELNNLDLEILSWVDDEIKAVIPEQARNGMIRVHIGDFLFADSPEFLVATPPVIDTCLPFFLEAGQPCELTGSGYRNRQGIGLLLVDGRVQQVADWRDCALKVDFLDPVFADCDFAQLQVMASNGLISEPVIMPGELSFGSFAVEPLVGVPAINGSLATEFVFTYDFGAENQDYTIRVMPDFLFNDLIKDDADIGKPGVQFGYTDSAPDKSFNNQRMLYTPAFEFTNTITGHTFVVPGPTLRIYNPANYHTYLKDITPLNFGRDDIPAPNEICYNTVDGTYLDFTYIDGKPYVSSALVDITDDEGNPRPSFTRDPNEFLRGGSDPRPYMYRHFPLDSFDTHPSSVMSLRGENLTDSLDYESLKIGFYELQREDYVGWNGNSGWTDTEVRFALPHTDLRGDHRIHHEIYGHNCRDNYLAVLLAPMAYSSMLEGMQVDLHDGAVRLDGEYFIWRVPDTYYDDEFGGIAGLGLLTIWEVPVIYTSPWTGEEVTKRELLVSPLAPAYHDYDSVYLHFADMDPDGDGLVTVEARSEDGTEARILDAQLTAGTASFFIWSGILDTGSLTEIANSGIFSESYDIELVRSEEENQPPVADLVNLVESQDIPAHIELSAVGSSDPDGQIVDYQWDLDGDGVFNESTWFEDDMEIEYRGSCSVGIHCRRTGSYRFGVKVTDSRGATDIAIIWCVMVDEYEDVTAKLALTNPDEFADVADTTFCVFRGNPECGGELVMEYIIESRFTASEPLAVPSMDWSEDIEDLPVSEDYWLQVTNPDVDWRYAAEKETLPISDTCLRGPILIACDSTRYFYMSGVVWR